MHLDNFVFIIPLCIFTVFWFFLLRPISKRHDMILNRLLAKEIARAIYKEIDQSSELHKSCTGTKEVELINVALGEFKKLQNKSALHEQ